MQYSDALWKAAKKYYYYCWKFDKAKTSDVRKFLASKREQYRLETARLFREEFLGSSSVGRTPDSDSGCPRFESLLPNQLGAREGW
jgi:hypothetical protein